MDETKGKSVIVEFFVPGAVVGKGRPKFARRGNFVSTYTPEKTASYENLVKLSAAHAMDASHPISVAVGAAITIKVIPPQGWSNKKRLAAISGDIRPTTKPDIDNALKGIFDAMNGIVFDDDKQIVELHCKKIYAEQAGAYVKVYEL